MPNQTHKDHAESGVHLQQETPKLSSEFTDTSGLAVILDVSESFLNKLRLTGDGPPFCKFGAAVRYDIPKALGWAATCERRSTSDRGAP